MAPSAQFPGSNTPMSLGLPRVAPTPLRLPNLSRNPFDVMRGTAPPVVTRAAPAAPAPAPARLPVTVVRTLPQLTPAVMPPSGGNAGGNPFAAAGMQQIGTAPSGAALWSNGNGQVFSGNAPSNLFGGMGFGGGGGSFRGVNNY